jgi:hypothetical protein
MECED